jgi:hypothetical protein
MNDEQYEKTYKEFMTNELHDKLLSTLDCIQKSEEIVLDDYDNLFKTKEELVPYGRHKQRAYVEVPMSFAEVFMKIKDNMDYHWHLSDLFQQWMDLEGDTGLRHKLHVYSK